MPPACYNDASHDRFVGIIMESRYINAKYTEHEPVFDSSAFHLRSLGSGMEGTGFVLRLYG